MEDRLKGKTFLTVKDVADVFSIHPQTVYTWVRRRRIPHFRVGGTIRFHPQQLAKWAKRRKNAGGW